ncbi:DUF3006 domain-containing protein [Natronococcus pandeyae]|uniref:DUF3006 domain-containing protein n=1 Tax=Natronococcus pandeyae TaxID=2055836 RepID=A0A8J8Q2M1_9EURY|nr:DUF3006 domain-containing protein [Natronococcus pandeyae]TYL37789.1 DUF3006 domain-containing protein [Natronococcus pandeyae]
MPVDSSFTGVIDDTTAVLLLEADGDVVEQLAVDVETLAEALFDCRVSGGALVDLECELERERAHRERPRETFDHLSRRPSER